MAIEIIACKYLFPLDISCFKTAERKNTPINQDMPNEIGIPINNATPVKKSSII